MIVQNKMDLVDGILPPNREGNLPSSTLTREGAESVRAALYEQARTSSSTTNDVLVNSRHAVLLNSLVGHLSSARTAIEQLEPADLVAIDIRAAVRILGEITGETWNPDVLDTIFSRFCIGK